jgi:hypothetical protein
VNNISYKLRCISKFRIRVAGVLAALTLIAVLGGGATASADVGVAGVWFETDATCTAQPTGSAGSLAINVRSNGAQAAYRTYLSEYQGSGKWSPWLAANEWHTANANDYNESQDFHFNRYLHRYWRVMMHYAVWTSAGWQYGGEYLQHYTEVNLVANPSFPRYEQTTYCYI